MSHGLPSLPDKPPDVCTLTIRHYLHVFIHNRRGLNAFAHAVGFKDLLRALVTAHHLLKIFSCRSFGGGEQQRYWLILGRVANLLVVGIPLHKWIGLYHRRWETGDADAVWRRKVNSMLVIKRTINMDVLFIKPQGKIGL